MHIIPKYESYIPINNVFFITNKLRTQINHFLPLFTDQIFSFLQKFFSKLRLKLL